jgi:hypothetical protein
MAGPIEYADPAAARNLRPSARQEHRSARRGERGSGGSRVSGAAVEGQLWRERAVGGRLGLYEDTRGTRHGIRALASAGLVHGSIIWVCQRALERAGHGRPDMTGLLSARCLHLRVAGLRGEHYYSWFWRALDRAHDGAVNDRQPLPYCINCTRSRRAAWAIQLQSSSSLRGAQAQPAKEPSVGCSMCDLFSRLCAAWPY